MVVAAAPAIGPAALRIAQDDGLFARAGLHVTIESPASATDTVPDLLRGKTDVAVVQWTTALTLAAKGVPLRALAPGNSGAPGLEQLVTLPGSPITRLSQLAGKTIAVDALRGLSQMLAESVLAPDVPVSRLHWAVVPFPEMGSALAAHQADAAFVTEPYLTQGETSRGLTTLTDIDQGPTQNFPVTGYFAATAWVTTHPALAAAFVSALEQGQLIAATSRQAVERALIRHLRITPLVAGVMPLGTFPVGAAVDPVELQQVSDLMQASGLLSKTANVPAIIRRLTS